MEIACCMLKNSGMEVTRAADGQEAVELFEKSVPGCLGAIYMDIHLTKPLDEAKMINALKQRIAERSAVKLRNDL